MVWWWCGPEETQPVNMHNTTKSPLELLEQRSKRLASKASNPAPAPSNRVPSTSNPSFERQVSRKSSTSSIGSILGAFRLSSLSVFDKEYSTPQSQRVPNTAASRPESLYDTESIIDAPVSLSSPSVGVTSSTGASPHITCHRKHWYHTKHRSLYQHSH